ncbi:YqaI family protein [Bacillus cereus]|uniref:YqaI family protein n=1 Tax=Bacillus cereus TaxID=1396 RepID=UPI00398060F1
MLENAMIMHNGYGIKDPQEYEPVSFEDELGTEVFVGDEILVSPNGNIILKENALEYLTDVLDYTIRKAGE